MPKQTTKQELVNKVNEKFYDIPKNILYNTFLGCEGADCCIEDYRNRTGDEPTKEIMKGFFEEYFLPNLKDIEKIAMISSVSKYLMGEKQDSVDEVKELKKQYRMLQSLINGCDSMEKLNMLKELPIMKE